MTLEAVMPYEFTRGEYDATEAFKYKDVEVTTVHSMMKTSTWKPWPGSHRFVHVWVELVNGKIVGWNENPSRGWSFPVLTRKVKHA